jgi:superfamily I DNA/RNA helicase
MPFGYNGLYILIGPPGTGKTRFLADRVEKIVQEAMQGSFSGHFTVGHSPVLICSLTRTAAAEIASRCPLLPREATATIHAHAYRAMGHPPVLDDTDIEAWNRAHPQWALSSAGAEDATEAPAARKAGDAEAAEYHLLRNRMTPRSLWRPDVEAFARAFESFKEDMGKVDYTDMIEQAPSRPPLSPRIVIVDEAQDTSRLAMNLLLRWIEHTGAGIVVGDPYQALYTWAGADPGILTDTGIDASHRGTLSQSYRVPRAVHAHAMDWIRREGRDRFPPVEYHPRDVEGSVGTVGANTEMPEVALALARDLANSGQSVMICAPCNYMLAPIVQMAREKGLPFSNPWRRREGSWNPLAPRKGITMPQSIHALLSPRKGPEGLRLWTLAEFRRWTKPVRVSDLLLRGKAKDLEAAAEDRPDDLVKLSDLTAYVAPEPLQALVDRLQLWLDGKDHGPLVSWWEALLKGDKIMPARYPLRVLQAAGRDALVEEPRVFLGTVHSFKGAEADHVIVFPDLSVKQAEGWAATGEDRDSIVRTFYVAFTRAKAGLHLAQPVNRYRSAW